MKTKPMFLVSLILSSYAYTLAASSHKLASALYQQLGRQAQERAEIPKKEQLPVFKMTAEKFELLGEPSFCDAQGIYIYEDYFDKKLPQKTRYSLRTCRLNYEAVQIRNNLEFRSTRKNINFGRIAAGIGMQAMLYYFSEYSHGITVLGSHAIAQIYYELIVTDKTIDDLTERHKKQDLARTYDLTDCFTCAAEDAQHTSNHIRFEGIAYTLRTLYKKRCDYHKNHSTKDDAKIYRKILTDIFLHNALQRTSKGPS